jgi:hypothetical protein
MRLSISHPLTVDREPATARKKTFKKDRISLLHIGRRRKAGPNAECNNGLEVFSTASWKSLLGNEHVYS